VKARATIISLFALLALTALAGPAAAAPAGAGLETFPVTCNGTPATVTASSGASFFIGDQHYVLTSITFTGAHGTVTKTYGKRTGLAGSEITCTATVTDPVEGTVNIVATGVAVP
jgi:hypothetical protein